MNRQLIARTFLGPMMVVILPLALFSQEPVQRGRVLVTVHDSTGAAVRGADVFVTSGEFEDTVRTNSNGVAQLSNVPHGPVRVVVAARGWVTNGKNEQLRGARLEIPIRLEREATTPSPSPSQSPSPTP